MPVPKPNIRWRGAHPNNFTVGRPNGGLDGRSTFHHVVGTRESAVLVFNQPSRGASSHFVVGADIIDQCVDVKDTAWTNTNWESNLHSITVEHEGGWDGDSPYSEEMYKNAIHLCAWLIENYGVSRPQRHSEVTLKSTACPGGLDLERIWREANALIAYYNKPVSQAEWLVNRKEIAPKTVFALPKNGGMYIYNLNTLQEADSRRFPVNQSFIVTGETIVSGQAYYITKSSMDLAAPNGILKTEVQDIMYSPQAPTSPQTPNWVDSVVNTENVEMYILRATPLIDLENGKPVQDKNGKEIWYQAGDIVKDISAHTVIENITYQLTEYSYSNINNNKYQLANGIKSSDLTLDRYSCPSGTPANPAPAPEPEYPVEDMPDVPEKPIKTHWMMYILNIILSIFKIRKVKND